MAARGRAGEPPSPHGARTFDELVDRLRQLRAWAGLGYHEVHRRVVELRRPRGIPERLVYNTVYRCFQPGRSRLDVEVVVDVARVLLGEDTAAEQWRLAHQVVVGLATDAEVVTVATALPADDPHFTGRDAELASLLGEWLRGEGPPGGGQLGGGHLHPTLLGKGALHSTSTGIDGVRVVTVDGMAGAGKTQFAIHAGHRLLRGGHFTDLQLWVNLRGHDPERPPADPAAVLGAFLRQLGVAGDQIYHLDLAGRAARYRRLLAGRRALVLLDNAAGEDQVRPLLPDGPGCLALVTSRRALTGLAGGRRLRLDVFTAREAIELLRRAAGPDRIDADRDTAARIVELVGHLPLALGLVAGRITHSPDWTLGDHLARLVERNRHRRLDDGVEIALHSSHDALREPARRLFRLLALHPGDDVDAYAAAAMAGTDLDTALAVVDELVISSLLRQRTHGRYELHDMVRLYAAARAVDEEPESARRDALTRLFDHYLHTAATAMAVLYPVRRGLLPIPEPPTSVPPVTEPAGARAWLAAERPNLLAAVAHGVAHGWPSHTHRLAATVARHLDIGGHHGDALAIHTHALGAARAMGDRHAEATTLGYLGILHWRVTRHDLSIEHTSRAIALFHELGDRTSEALALANIGVVAELAGRYEESAGYALRSLAVCREAGHRDGEGIALNNVGLALLRLGRYAESVEYSQRSLDIRHEQGDRAGEALVLCNLGAAYQYTGRHPEAIDHYRRALAIGRETGYRHVECHALSWLGVLDQREGHLERAVERNRQALAIAAVLDDASLESEVRNNLGHALRATGRPVEAQEHHRSAIALASAAGFRLDHARALDGLAHAMSAAGRATQARQHWQAALTIHHELGTPEAGEIRARLAELDREPA